MKKTIAVLLALLLMMTVVFFGCGKEDKEEGNDANEDETTTLLNEDTTAQAGGDDGTTQGQPSSDSTSPSSSGVVEDSTSEKDESTEVSETNPVSTTNSAENTGSYNVYNYKRIFESGNYTMTVLVEDDSGDMPMTMSLKNGNMRLDMTMDGMAASVLYRVENDTTYMLINIMGMNVYCDVSEDMLGEDFDFSTVTDEFKLDIPGEVAVSQATFNGVAATCESYVDDGTVVKFYFDKNGNILGREDVAADGTVETTVISEFSAEVDDSVFEIPAGYTYMDLSWMMDA